MNVKRIKEFDIARVIAIILMVAVHTEYAIYNFHNETFGAVFANLGSPFCAPIFMFILGANVFLSRNNSPKKLFTRGLKIFGFSYIFNVICHALPFFILDNVNNTINYGENALHWIFAVDILTFAGLALMFFALVKKLKISNKILIIIGAVLCMLNYVLVTYLPIDFNAHPLLAGITSIFYNSSMPGYFSFFGWIFYPIIGYLFIQVRQKVNNLDKFYLYLGIISIVIYVVMVIVSNKVDVGTYLIYPGPDNSYYYNHPYQAVGYTFFCFAWLSILYFVSKIIPTCFDIHIARLNKNLTAIYVVQWFIINYCLVLPSNYSFFANEWQFILCFIGVLIISDLIVYLYKKYLHWKMV